MWTMVLVTTVNTNNKGHDWLHLNAQWSMAKLGMRLKKVVDFISVVFLQERNFYRYF